MLSEGASGTAVRATERSRVTSFWDDAPVTAAASQITSPYVSATSAQAAAAKPTAASAPKPVAEPATEPAAPRTSFAELERDAFMKGYAQGERSGAEAAAKRGEATLRRLAQTVEELAGLRTELVQKTERQVVELALAIAGRVLRREVSLDRELLVAMARIALERLGENTSATIRLNPDDYAFIGAQAQVGDSSLVRVVADPLVSSGGCLVQSDFGLIDVGIDAQLGEMASALGVSMPAAAPAQVRAGRGAA
ncbi:MAG: FliH/SctL family protein [Vicinamibacterales bacterium]